MSNSKYDDLFQDLGEGYDVLSDVVRSNQLVFCPFLTQHGVVGSAIANFLRPNVDVVVNEVDALMCRPTAQGKMGTLADMFDRLAQIYEQMEAKHQDQRPMVMVSKFMCTSFPPGQSFAPIFKLNPDPIFILRHPVISMETRLKKSCELRFLLGAKGEITVSQDEQRILEYARKNRRYDIIPDDLLDEMVRYYTDRFCPVLGQARYAPRLDEILGTPGSEDTTFIRQNRHLFIEFLSAYGAINEYIHYQKPLHAIDGTAFQSAPDAFKSRILDIWNIDQSQKKATIAPVFNQFDALQGEIPKWVSQVMFGDTFQGQHPITYSDCDLCPLDHFPEKYRRALGILVPEYYRTLAHTMNVSSSIPYCLSGGIQQSPPPLVRFDRTFLGAQEKTISGRLRQQWDLWTSPIPKPYKLLALDGLERYYKDQAQARRRSGIDQNLKHQF